jgi:tRNA A37 N6-isopentenylltransferase MiaA
MNRPPVQTFENVRSPLILVGPTTAGKSDVAAAISDMTGGTIITADRGYMYAKPDLFWLGLGLVPGELDDGRPRRLFGTLEPLDPPLDPTAYMETVRSEVDAIHALGGLAIIEGCTRRYNRELMRQYGLDHALGIFWPSATDLHGKLTRRVQAAVGMGMYEEVEAALDAGYGDAHPMTTVPYIHSMNVLAGRERRTDAEAAIANELAQISIEHRESYVAIDGLDWFVHESGSTENVAVATLASLSARNS